jgi:fibronectin type 3 domain-containing protein
VTPPAAPASLTATAGIGHVSLDWDTNIESDLAGYDIYRSLTPGGPYTLIQNVTASAYSDDSANNGVMYYYVVTAKDTSGHTSGNSNEGSALPPDLTDDDRIDLEDLAKVAQAWLTTYNMNDLLVIAEHWLSN